MAVKIRLRQQGRANRQTYRLVVTDIRNPRDGKYLEMLGWHNPFAAEDVQSQIDVERINYWVGQGAQITPSAGSLIAKMSPHTMRELNGKKHTARVKQAAKRRARKTAAAQSAAK